MFLIEQIKLCMFSCVHCNNECPDYTGISSLVERLETGNNRLLKCALFTPAFEKAFDNVCTELKYCIAYWMEHSWASPLKCIDLLLEW